MDPAQWIPCTGSSAVTTSPQILGLQKQTLYSDKLGLLAQGLADSILNEQDGAAKAC